MSEDTTEQEEAAREYLAAGRAEQFAHQAVLAARKRLHAAFDGNVMAAGIAVAHLATTAPGDPVPPGTLLGFARLVQGAPRPPLIIEGDEDE